MRRVEKLIKQIRRVSDNEEFDNDPDNPLGIIDDEVVEYINEAQRNLQARISLAHPKRFIKEDFIDLVAEQEEYSLPSDIFLGTRLIHVEALFTNQAGDYYTLDQRHVKERLPSQVKATFPNYYIRLGNKIYIQPRPTTNKTNGIRLTYQKTLPKLDIRRGIITSITNPSGSSLTEITLELSPTLGRDTDLPLIAERTIEDFDFITVVGSDGTIKMDDIPVDDYDSTTGVITITPGFEFGTGESAAAGDYIVGGRKATTHSELPDTVQRYLIAYAAWKLLKRDSSVDSRDQERELVAMLDEIVDSFSEVDEDQINLNIDEEWMI